MCVCGLLKSIILQITLLDNLSLSAFVNTTGLLVEKTRPPRRAFPLSASVMEDVGLFTFYLFTVLTQTFI